MAASQRTLDRIDQALRAAAFRRIVANLREDPCYYYHRCPTCDARYDYSVEGEARCDCIDDDDDDLWDDPWDDF